MPLNSCTRFVIISSVILAFLGFYSVTSAQAEVIDNFDSNITIQTNGDLLVNETIFYDFGVNQKHGIFRDIPLSSSDGPRISITVLSVTDQSGQAYSYNTSTTGDTLHIKIGDPNVLLNGTKTYMIRYQVAHAIRSFSDHDELYWNVTGNQWPVVIQRATVSVILPAPVIPNIRMDCFTGIQGSVQKNCTFTTSSSGTGTVSYDTSQPLNPGEGLTVVLGLPPGYITQPAYTELPQQSGVGTNTGIATPFLIILIVGFSVPLLLLIVMRPLIFASKKPKPVIPKELKGRPIVVEYNPPDSLPPIEIGTLLDRRVDITDISSVIMDLAVRGYLKIRYTVEPIRFFPDKKDFELIKNKDGSDLVHPADKTIFSLLFSGRDSVTLSQLQKSRTSFQSTIKLIKDSTEQHLHEKGYFDQAAEDKSKKLRTFFVIGILALFIGRFFTLIFSSYVVFILYAIGTTAVVMLALRIDSLAHKLSAEGVATLAKILGFREFLQLTEKDKLDLLNAPELQPETFEKFLPYAMVLGVEDKWAKKFEGIYTTSPTWYEDPTAPVFNSFQLTQTMHTFGNSFNQVFSNTSPRSSSGFSGGFSGGGSGGGGGGSW